MRNLLRNLTVFVVDAIAYPIGWAIDRTMSDFHFYLESDSPDNSPSQSDESSRWDKFDFDDYEDKR